jgi:hypothetical protein
VGVGVADRAPPDEAGSESENCVTRHAV